MAETAGTILSAMMSMPSCTRPPDRPSLKVSVKEAGPSTGKRMGRENSARAGRAANSRAAKAARKSLGICLKYRRNGRRPLTVDPAPCKEDAHARHDARHRLFRHRSRRHAAVLRDARPFLRRGEA